MKPYIDLHTHSTASDGTLTPRELVSLGKQIGLGAIALTDHDTVSGIDEFLKAGSEFSLDTVPGIELAAMYKNTEIHILGLFINHESKELLKTLDFLVEKRYMRNVEMLKKLELMSMNISYDELLAAAGGDIITRAHYAKLLVEKGYASDKSEVFSKLISPGCPAYVQKSTLTPVECIDCIKAARGVPILAHPTLYGMSYLQIHNLVASLVPHGLLGIETFYSSFTPSQECEMQKIANYFHIACSGGSDFHGKNKNDISLGTGRGNLKIPYELLVNLEALAL